MRHSWHAPKGKERKGFVRIAVIVGGDFGTRIRWSDGGGSRESGGQLIGPGPRRVKRIQEQSIGTGLGIRVSVHPFSVQG